MNELSKVKVKCVKCGVEIPFENGAFQECPLGHPAPTEQQIREAVYLQLSGQQNAEIKREFADLRDKPDDLVYVHPLAEHLPRYAVLYVEDNQIAVYDHCGAREFLRGPGRVIITGDDRSDSELLKAYAMGEGEHVLRNIGSKVTFVDLQQHVYASDLLDEYRNWQICFQAHYNMQIVDPHHLVQVAFDFRREPEEVAAYIRKCIEQSICDGVLDKLDSYTDIDWRNADADQLRQAIVQRLRRPRFVMEEVMEDINASLRRIGVTISCDPRNLIDWGTLVVTNTDTTVEHRCPNHIEKDGVVQPCSGSKRLPTGDQRRWVCPVCGATVRWCDSCNGYKHFDEADSESPNRFCRSCGKSNYN